ncbi:hypothetical protein [Pseudocolwellia sp. HL-MZ7]|uniref:hypothetical protein n=1 Tax=Pseudocolwellia sp. HL-MZ7 TaxID=3400627 RepID=UPI003CE993D1
MINIGTTDFYLGVPSLPVDEFESYSTKLFEEWEEYVGDILKLPDYCLVLDVQEGSISAKSKILVGATAICGFLATYGSISSGAKNLYTDITAAGNYLGIRASAPFPDANVKPKIRNRGEALSKLQSLFVRVAKGTLSPEEAMILARNIFGDDVPEFMDQLKDSLEKTPSQLSLPIEEPEEQSIILPKDNDREPPSRKPKVHVIRPEQYRVEIWRESKKSERNIRVRKV